MIKWSDIESQCGPYKERLVAVFREYETQETDEQDAYGRPVTVTVSSFTRHMGIDRSTFRHWINKIEKGVTRTTMSDEVREQLTDRRMTHNEKVSLGLVPDITEAERKAIRAETREAFEPLMDALGQLKRVGVADIIRECADDIREGRWDEEDRADIDTAVDELVLARMEMHVKHESES